MREQEVYYLHVCSISITLVLSSIFMAQGDLRIQPPPILQEVEVRLCSLWVKILFYLPNGEGSQIECNQTEKSQSTTWGA